MTATLIIEFIAVSNLRLYTQMTDHARSEWCVGPTILGPPIPIVNKTIPCPLPIDNKQVSPALRPPAQC